jgi:nicotinic acid mononucleotide adenylyltransferase
MVIDILTATAVTVLIVMFAIMMKKQNKAEKHIIKLAMKVAELESAIRDVDESTGLEINRLGRELRDFRESYGDAAVEEIRERARQEKAWADGISNIMAYGAQYQGKGE